MIRTEGQLQRVLAVREELAALSSSFGEGQEQRSARQNRLRELDAEIAEYEALNSGDTGSLLSEGVASLGELLIKARLARGLSMSELGKLLGMTQQQVGRYEREGWRRASMWRLEQVAGALEIEVNIRATLSAGYEDRASTGTVDGS